MKPWPGPASPRHPAAEWWEDATCSWSTSCPLLLLSVDHPLRWFRHAKRCWRPKPYHGQRAKARNLSWGWRMHDESASHCCETTLKQHAWTCFKVTNPKWFPIAWRKRSWPAWHPLPSFTSSACSIILSQETECPHHSLFHGARFPAFPLALGACLVAGSDDPSTHSWSTDDMSRQFHSRLITDVFVSFVLEVSVLLTSPIIGSYFNVLIERTAFGQVGSQLKMLFVAPVSRQVAVMRQKLENYWVELLCKKCSLHGIDPPLTPSETWFYDMPDGPSFL